MVIVLMMLPIALMIGGCTRLAEYLLLPKHDVREVTHKVLVQRDVTMTARDGIALYADLYRPITPETLPTILVRIPYSKTIKTGLGVDVIANYWSSRGYNVMVQTTRGRNKSGGLFYPLRNERDDGIDTLHWLKSQTWFDGRLGMWGGSAFGYTQWAVADQKTPGPTALNIQIASTNFREMFHPGGAFSLESALFWAVRSRGAVDADPLLTDLERGFDGFPLIEADNRAGWQIPFFDDWATHVEKDSYWLAIDGEHRARTLAAPALLMAGWYDPFLPTQLRDFETIRSQARADVAAKSRLIIGPWSHAEAVRFPDGGDAGDYRPASIEPSIEWFDQHLKGFSPAPRFAKFIRLYVMGENVWRDEDAWPLERTVYTPLYLHSQGRANSDKGDGRLLPAPLTTQFPEDSYDYNPGDAVPSRGGAMLGPRAGIYPQHEIEQRSDVLVYTTDQLTRDTEVTGPVQAVLHIATSAANTDFTAKLVDVYPDGKSYNVTDGLLRRAYPKKSDGTAPPTEITIELWPTSMVFRKGHRIRLEISSSNFPRYDRNPNTCGVIATEKAYVTAHQRVFHDSGRPSRVILPIIPR